MKRTKSRQHIYALVLTKQKTYIIAVVALALIMTIIGSYFMPKNGGKVYNSILKSCIDSFVLADSPHEYKGDFPLSLSAYTVFSQISPVFFKDENTPSLVSDGEIKEIPPAPSTTVAAKAKNKVITKAAVSHSLAVKNETDYLINPQELVSEKRTYSAKSSGAKVLIIHTHGCETYSTKNGAGLGENGSYRTTDTSKNMVKIGEIMTEVFNQNGIGVIHDTTLCDYPNYNSSYVKSLEVIEWHLKNNPDIRFVFDIHRDAIETQDGTPTKLLCKINGNDTAQAMIVCGTDAMGLDNPNWQENLILALKIQKNLEDMYPGFMRPLNLRKERFNMHKTKGSLLFEVGTHANTLEEAKNSARHLAEGIVKTIKD